MANGAALSFAPALWRRSVGRGRSIRAEELAQLLRIDLGLFERGEVSASSWLADAYDVRCALEPRPWRTDDVAWKQREAGGHPNPPGELRGLDRSVRWYIRIDEPIVPVSQ